MSGPSIGRTGGQPTGHPWQVIVIVNAGPREYQSFNLP
jgi:hypothetical protein